MLSMNRVTLLGTGNDIGYGSRGRLLGGASGGLGAPTVYAATSADVTRADVINLQKTLKSIGQMFPDYDGKDPVVNPGKGDLSMQPLMAQKDWTKDQDGKTVAFEVNGDVTLVTGIALLNTIKKVADKIDTVDEINKAVDDIVWLINTVEGAIPQIGHPWEVVENWDAIVSAAHYVWKKADSIDVAVGKVLFWIAKNAYTIGVALEAARVLILAQAGGTPPGTIPGDDTPSDSIPGGGGDDIQPPDAPPAPYYEKSYPIGSVKRYNTTRNIWSIYAPVGVYETADETAARMAAVMKTHRTMVASYTKPGRKAGLGATYPEANEPNPTVTNQHGVVLQTIKVDEVPGYVNDTNQTNVGTETDKGTYPAGSIARWNTTRNVWSVYSPTTIAGLGMFSEGLCIYGLGADATVTSPDPDPPAPAGTSKKAEVPGSPITPPPGTQNGGNEKDKTSFYTRWWFWAGLGGAAAAGTAAYFLLRKNPSGPVSGAAGGHPGFWVRLLKPVKGLNYYKVGSIVPVYKHQRTGLPVWHVGTTMVDLPRGSYVRVQRPK